jgi:hypothetical protein
MLGEKQAVQGDLDKYIAKYPADGEGHFLRAQLYVLDKKWQLGVADLTPAIVDGYYLEKALRARAACYRSMHENSLAAIDVGLVEKFRQDIRVVRDLSKITDH